MKITLLFLHKKNMSYMNHNNCNQIMVSNLITIKLMIFLSMKYISNITLQARKKQSLLLRNLPKLKQRKQQRLLPLNFCKSSLGKPKKTLAQLRKFQVPKFHLVLKLLTSQMMLSKHQQIHKNLLLPRQLILLKQQFQTQKHLCPL